MLVWVLGIRVRASLAERMGEGAVGQRDLVNSGPVGVVEVLEVRYNEGVAQMVC